MALGIEQKNNATSYKRKENLGFSSPINDIEVVNDYATYVIKASIKLFLFLVYNFRILTSMLNEVFGRELEDRQFLIIFLYGVGFKFLLVSSVYMDEQKP